MRHKLKPVLTDLPLWLGAIVLIFLLARALHSDPIHEQSVEAQVEDALDKVSRGESAELHFDQNTSIQVDPIFDENGDPIDVQSILAKLDSAAPKRLAEAEQLYGPNDPRTISPRSAMVAVLLKKKQAAMAAALAGRNYAIAVGYGSATAVQRLTAVESVLLTLPRAAPADDLAKRLNDLLIIVEEQAGEAPGKAAELYGDIGVRQTKLGLYDEAARSFRSVLALAQGSDVNPVSIATAHMGLSGQAWQAGDCETALGHAKQAMIALEETALGDQLQAMVARQTAPMFAQCGP